MTDGWDKSTKEADFLEEEIFKVEFFRSKVDKFDRLESDLCFLPRELLE